MVVRSFVPQIASMWPGLRSLTTGSTYTMSRIFSQQDATDFVRLTGDSNPIHVDVAVAAAAGYSSPILPGMLIASLFPAIIGSTFPGALYLTQTLKFRQPACVGATVRAEVTVATQSGKRMTFNTVCKDVEGNVIVDGAALALIKELE